MPTKTAVNTITINDLRHLSVENKPLTPQQHLALKNFERYKIYQLNQPLSETAFHKKYKQIQVIANLSSFEEFLKEEYCV